MSGSRISPDTPEDRALRAAVHPDGWVNPAPQDSYNLVVIGGGTAGLVCAAGAAGLGAKVALVERNLLGGDCLNNGCVPSKALLRAARAIHDARNSAAFGVRGGESLRFDFSAAMERMRHIRATLSRNDSARRLHDELGVDLFFGQGRFIAPDCIEVEGARLSFARAAICSGARAAAPPIPGLAENGYLTNESVFSLAALPPRLAVIGAGPVGCELAQAFARFGSCVTLLEGSSQILGREDHDARQIVYAALTQDGVEIRTGVSIAAVAGGNGEKKLSLVTSGGMEDLIVDEILVGAGRKPNIDDLGLECAGIDSDPLLGVTVSDTLRTSNPRVYAAGDVCSMYKFTHSADAQARIVIANALFLGRQKSSALTIPWCTYTDPAVAHVGLYEKEAMERGLRVTTLTVPLTDVDRAVLDGECAGFARVLLQEGSDTILGATVVSRQAGELIGEITIAMTSNLGLAAIGRTIHPYPTVSEALKKLADQWNRTRLTPPVKSILHTWLKWRL